MAKTKEKPAHASPPPEEVTEKKKRVFRRSTITNRNVARSVKSNKPVFRGKPLVRDARRYINMIVDSQNVVDAEQIQSPRNIRSEFKRGMAAAVGTVLLDILDTAKEALELHGLDRLTPKFLDFAVRHELKRYGFKYKYKIPVLPSDDNVD